MKIRIAKRADGSGLLRCDRLNGTSTWQKQTKHAVFFTTHDLTHFAVEIVLGYRRGFFGLVAEGWDIDDTTGKGARGPLPQDAAEVELVVGLLDSERASGSLMTAHEFNGFLKAKAADSGRQPRRPISADELLQVRARRAELLRAWSDVAPGGELTLEWM